MAETMRESVKDALETAADRAKATATRVADRVEPLHNGVKGAARSAADTATGVKDEVVDALGSGCTAAEQLIGGVGKDVGELVRKYPVAALAIGLGIGMLLGRSTCRA